MNYHAVKTDETGLHAVDCDCVTCETGYRPTELERAAARRSLAIRKADEAKRAAAKVEEPKKVRPRLEPPKSITPLTAEQWAELERMRKEIRR